jgi:dihydrofolate reductase
MGKVISEISVSLDGFITDPNASVGTPLEGNDPGRLHDWKFDAKTETDEAIVEEMYDSTGAVLIGKRMFDVGFEPWGDPPPFGMPVFIVTHEEREPLPMQGGTTYTFVTDGIEAALELARAAPGDKNVGIWGRPEHHEAVSEGQIARRDADPPRLHPDRGRHPALRGSRR